MDTREHKAIVFLPSRIARVQSRPPINTGSWLALVRQFLPSVSFRNSDLYKPSKAALSP